MKELVMHTRLFLEKLVYDSLPGTDRFVRENVNYSCVLNITHVLMS